MFHTGMGAVVKRRFRRWCRRHFIGQLDRIAGHRIPVAGRRTGICKKTGQIGDHR